MLTATASTAATVPFLADQPLLEHEHAVGDRRHDTEVVRDEQQAEPELVAQLGEQLEHRRLHGDVERRRDLVADDELGPRAPARARSPTRWRSPPDSSRG